MEGDELGFAPINRECRFCFGSDTTISPLIRPCNCKGTQAYIHSECLNKWQRIQINNRPWSSRFCSVCRHPYITPRSKSIVPVFLNVIKYSNLQIFTIILKFISVFFLIIYTKISFNFILTLGGPVALILLFFIILLSVAILIFEYFSSSNITRLELQRGN